MKFQASAAGFITQLEYLRGAADASDIDVRSGHLWGPDGTLLATATFTSTPGQTGWQTAALSTPVAIQPGATYLASYHTDNNYVFTSNYFNSSAHNGPDGFLTAPASSSAGGNGVFSTGASPSLPNQTFNASNYWVDVTFKPLTVTGPNAPPQITSGTAFTTPENQTAVTTVTATDPDLPAQTLSYSILLPTGTNGASADGALFQIDPATGALSFKTAPDFEAPRDAGADNVYNLTVAVADGAGGVTQQNLAVTVGNVAEPPGAPANFTGRTVQASYIFGATPDALFTGAGAVQTATVDAAAGGAVEFPLLPSAGPDVGNGQFGLASVDVGSTAIRLEFPLDPAVFSGSVNFASAADRPFNGVRLTAADGLLPKILGVSIAGQAGFTKPLTASDVTVTSNGIFLNVAGNGRLVDSDPAAPGVQPSFVQLAVDLNDAPVITSNGGGDTAAITVPGTSTLVTTLSATDADAGQVLTYSIVPASAGSGEDAALFEIRGTDLYFQNPPADGSLPPAGKIPGYQVTVEVSDGQGGFDTQDITVDVTPSNRPPVAVADATGTKADTPVIIPVLANDTDPDNNPLTVSAAANGTHGTTVVNPDGTVTYTPAAGFNGQDQFAYTISDGQGGTSSSTVTVTVASVPPPPGAGATTDLGPPGGADLLVLRVSQDAYQGGAQYDVSLDGVKVNTAPLTVSAAALHGLGVTDTVNLRADLAGGGHNVSVSFLNDAYGGPGLDRNLFVDGITYKDDAAPASVTVPNSTAPLFSNGTASFGFSDASAPPPPPQPGTGATVNLGPATGKDLLVLAISQDAYQGGAQYDVSLDGVKVNTAPLTVSAAALHGSGVTDTVNLRADLAGGGHNVSVSFLNDAYGGPGLDRNLFVDGITYKDDAAPAPVTVPNSTAPLFNSGRASFGFSDASAAPPPPPPGTGATTDLGPPGGADLLVLKVSQDAYQGSAQYDVSLDGVKVNTAPLTVSAAALHGSGVTDTVNLRADLAGGGHNVSVSFLNDAYGGPGLDRNLFVDGITYKDDAAPAPVTVPNSTAPLFSSGTASFGFSDASAAAPISPVTIGSGAHRLVLQLDQDAYQGSAQYDVSVDGAKVNTAPLTVNAAALHGSGQEELLTVLGEFTAGVQHTLDVTFLNDAYGGPGPGQDRNLYVAGITYDGAVVPGGTAALYSAGTHTFTF